MSKMKLFKQAEQMFLKGLTVSEISLELGIAKRTLFYWKKQYDWDKKRKNPCMINHSSKRICRNLPKNL